MEDNVFCYTLKGFNSSKKRRTCHDLTYKKYSSDCSANHKRIIGKKAQKSQAKGGEIFSKQKYGLLRRCALRCRRGGDVCGVEKFVPSAILKISRKYKKMVRDQDI